MKPILRSACVALVLALPACAPAIRGSTPAEQVRSLRGRDAVAVLRSGEQVVLRGPVVEGDSVVGGWTSGPAGDVRVAVALADVQEMRLSPPPSRRQDEKFPAGRLARQSLLIGFAACVALMLSFAVFGM
jgi:hypothetical protein